MERFKRKGANVFWMKNLTKNKNIYFTPLSIIKEINVEIFNIVIKMVYISGSSLCDFYNMVIETLECRHVQSFWMQLIDL